MKAPPKPSPSIEFMKRAKGTLEETISAVDLPTLNQALAILFADLREAARLSEREGDNGRSGAALAMDAAWRFLVLFKNPLAGLLHLPFLKLEDALTGLENNRVDPIIRPVRQKGRSPSSHGWAALKGHAAGTVRRLRKAGVPRTEAFERVAKILAKHGVKSERGSGDITATTVRHWCRTVAEDVARSSTAATVFDEMFTAEEEARLANLTPHQAQTRALQSLEKFAISTVV